MSQLVEQQKGRVKLDVGGQFFHTSVSNLTKYSLSFLGVMFSGRHALVKENDGSYFIDRSPKHFDLVLSFLRDGEVLLPSNIQLLQEILREVQFYQLSPLEEIVQDKVEQLISNETHSHY